MASQGAFSAYMGAPPESIKPQDGVGSCSTKAEKAQRRFRENGTAELGGQDDQVRRQNVGHNVVKHHPDVANGPRPAPLRHRRFPWRTGHSSAQCGPCGDDGDGYGHNEIRQRAPQHRDNRQSQNEQGEGQYNVYRPLQQEVGLAAQIGADDTQDRATSGADKRRGQANEQGNAGPVYEAGQHITAELVRSQPVRQRSAPGHCAGAG